MHIVRQCIVDRALLFVLCLALTVLHVCASTSLNIHIRLDGPTELLAMKYDQQIHSLAPEDDVFLNTLERPHITLFLTQFEDQFLPTVINRTQAVVALFSPCVVSLLDPLVSGQYGMWEANVPPCLQYMSDSVVNATCAYITPNQPVPDWVLSLPEPLRSEKIEMIHKYGSPNVFSQFQPHVTLAFDSSPTDNLTAVFSQLDIPPTSFVPPYLGIGSVGPHGTVLRGKDYALFAIPSS